MMLLRPGTCTGATIYAPLADAALKALDTVKVVENSAKRYFIQSREFKSITGGSGTTRRWMAAIPVQTGPAP
jgi:hypothetical protein